MQFHKYIHTYIHTYIHQLIGFPIEKNFGLGSFCAELAQKEAPQTLLMRIGKSSSILGTCCHQACAAFVCGLAVSEAKTDVMCFRTKGIRKSIAISSVEAVGQVYNQNNEFKYLVGNVNYNHDLSNEVDRRIRHAWCSFRKYTLLELYGRPSPPLELKLRM